MWAFSTKAIDWGFFLPPEHDAFSTAAICEALLAPRQFAVVPLPGLTGQLQFFRVILAERGGTTTDHMVLFTHYPRLADAAVRSGRSRGTQTTLRFDSRFLQSAPE